MPLRKYLKGFGLVPILVFHLIVVASCATPSRQLGANSQIWEPQNPKFRSFYGWDNKVGSWEMERIRGADGGSVAVHIFYPPLMMEGKGTVFLLHGYLDHTALRVPIVLEFVKMGWTVVGVDLPGHGLSSGKRADIDSFDDYWVAFESAINLHSWPKPWRAVGHSTGAATILLTLQRGAHEFEFIVLESPLIRSFMWNTSIWLKKFLGDELLTLPRRSESSQAEKPLNRLGKTDPLYISAVPLHFVDAVEKYYQSTLEWKPMKGRMLILQGEKDTALDIHYSIPFLRSILPDAVIIQIEGGRHHLFMDAGPAGVEARKALFSRW